MSEFEKNLLKATFAFVVALAIANLMISVVLAETYKNTNKLVNNTTSHNEVIATNVYGDILYLEGNHFYTHSQIYDTILPSRDLALEYFQEISVMYLQDAHDLIDLYELEIKILSGNIKICKE